MSTQSGSSVETVGWPPAAADLEIGDGTLIVYSTDNHDAWVQSDMHARARDLE